MAAIRAACSPQIWSRGVVLSRAGAVVGERRIAGDVEVHVTEEAPGGRHLVVLYPEELEWSCDCDARGDACVHAAAAVIAVNRARKANLPAAAPQAMRPLLRLGYRFSRTSDGLALERSVTGGGDKERPLTVSLVELGRQSGGYLMTERSDVQVETLLGGRIHGLLSRMTLHKVLEALHDCPNVSLDGQPVTVGEAQPVMRGRLEKRAAGLYLTLVQDPAVHEVFGNGAVRCGNVLRPIGELKLSAGEVNELRHGRFIPPHAVPQLATEILPALRRRLPVDVVGVRLPEVLRLPPRIELRVSEADGGLSVLALMVYGSPAVARIDSGVLRRLDDNAAIPVRDTDAEGRLGRRLFEELGLEVGHRKVVHASEAVRLSAAIDAFGAEIRGTAHTAFRVTAGALTPHVAAGATDFEVSFTAAPPASNAAPASGGGGGGGADGGSVSAANVLGAWQRGENMVQLLDGGWVPLPEAWLHKHGHRLLDLMAARDEAGKLPPAALPQLADLCDALEQPKPPSLAQLQARLANFDKIPPATLPADLHADLRPYQRRGVDWLSFVRDCGMGAMLADDMGLGKTLQALCAIRGRTLVVAPTSVLHNWESECARFRPGLRCAVYHGPGRRLDRRVDVTLTTYALLRLDAATLGDVAWDTVVLDEAQAIKNPDSQVARAAYGLQAAFRITLTGTPVENRLDELWSQFHFINRGLLGGRQEFAERYGRPLAQGEAGAAARLRDRTRPFLLRRLKTHVAPELPQRTDLVLRCTLSEAERGVYDTIRASTMKDVLERLLAGGNVMAVLEALLRLRQACCHPNLVPGQQPGMRSAKLELLVETLEEALAEGHRALVFSQWTNLLDLVEPALTARKITFTRLDGSTADRGAVVREFQAENGPPVMLVSLKAGGTGLNLTAADHVFLLDPWWNPAVEDQAADRAHRIGQTRPVFVHRLVAEDTVEEKILALQEEKRAVAVAALEGTDAGAALTRDDLLALLQ